MHKWRAVMVGMVALCSASASAQALGANELWTSGTAFGSTRTLFGDIDGDLRADMVLISAGTVSLRKSTGSAFGVQTTIATGFSFDRDVFIADANGDGYGDLVSVNNTNIIVRPYNFSTSALGSPLTYSSAAFFGSDGTWFTDLDGDGDADGIVRNGANVNVIFSSGGLTGYPSTPNVWASGSAVGEKTVFGQVNNDSIADMVMFKYVSPGYWQVYVSFGGYTAGGTFFFGSPVLQTLTVGDVFASGLFLYDMAFTVDYAWKEPLTQPGRGQVVVNYIHNSSGHTDSLWASGSGGASAFNSIVTLNTSPYFGNVATAFIDCTGDWKVDGIVVNSSGPVVLRRSP